MTKNPSESRSTGDFVCRHMLRGETFGTFLVFRILHPGMMRTLVEKDLRFTATGDFFLKTEVM